MQPKTKQQKRVMELYKTLKPLTQAQEKWGKQIYPTKAFFDRNGNICACCGQPMGDNLICPVCGRKHDKRAENNRQRAVNTSFNICQAVGEFQVVRTFAVHSLYRKGKQAQQDTCEVCQTWIDAQGKEVRVSRGKSIFGSDFIWATDMEIRKSYSYYGYSGDLHHYYQATDTYPRGAVAPVLKRNGINSVAMVGKVNISPVDFIKKLLTDSKTETLVKTGNLHLVGKYDIDKYWKQFCITLRNGYKIQDWSIWTDTISMLQKEGKDIHNPVYVCPQDINALHDELLRKAENRRQREEYMKRLAKQDNPKAQKMYKDAKGMYFGICITDKDLSIEVLKSIKEFIAEGQAMHHCVSQCAYYSKENSLILSAKVNGKRMETIEVDLTNFHIVQSRGKCNQNSPYHDRIVDLMQSNMGQIKAIKKKANKVA